MKSKFYLAIACSSIFKPLVVATGLFASAPVFAATPWILCEHCQQSDAQSASVQTGHIGEIAIFSLRNRFVSKFENVQQVVGDNCHPNRVDPVKAVAGAPIGTFRAGDCTYQIVATSVSMTPEDNLLNALLQNFYDSNGGSMKSVVNVSSDALFLSDGPITGANRGSAIDFANNNSFRGEVRTAARAYIDSPGSIVAAIGNAVVGAGTVLMLGADGTKITIVVKFDDGSTVTLVYTEGVAFDSETALTAENGNVMNAGNLSEFLGSQMLNNSQSFENFLANARHLGIEITTGNGGLIPREVSCHRIPDGVSCSRN